MIIEIDPTFKTALLNVLSKYQEKKRFKEDCTTLQCMVNTRKHRGIPIEGISNLVGTIVNYCKKELRSNTIRLPFNWKFTIQTKRNGLYLALKRTVHEQMTQALVRENALCHMTLRMLPTPAEVSAMQAQKNQLEEDLTAMTNRADQAELDSSTKQKRIEKLVKENKILDQQLKSTQEELDRLKGKVIYLEEEKIPTLAADFKRQLKDFQDEMKRETEKQMVEFRKTLKEETQYRPTHRFSSPGGFSSFSSSPWLHQKGEPTMPLLGQDHPKLGKTGQRVMIT